MKNFNPATTQALAAETAAIFWFLEMGLDSGVLRYSDADFELYSGGNLYRPKAFEVQELVFTADMSVDRMSVDFHNIDLQMSAIILNETIVNRQMKISFGCLDSSNKIIALEDIFDGILTAWGPMTVKECPVTIGNYMMFWSQQSLRLAQATCPWAFKSTGNPECGYVGSETECNKSWRRCVELQNQLQFGGHRWLPGLIDKKIYWGMYPGQAPY